MSESVSTLVGISELDDLRDFNFDEGDQSISILELLDQIENRHHKFLKKMLTNMRLTVNRIRQEEEIIDQDLSAVFVYFEQLASEQLSHMNKEETILFPYIKSLCSKDESPLFEGINFGSLNGPLSVMEMEHENAVTSLEMLRGLTDDFTAPEWGSSSLKGFYRDLGLIESDLLVHIHKEDIILFPKAIAREQEFYSEA
jgi:regulator of cell morphogenesis and NO signaling